MFKPKKVLVIGGGVIGISTAYFLWKAGHEVTVVEKGDIGQACSFGNAGLIVPSHIIPLASPGVVTEALRWLFNVRAPFYIQPRFDLRLYVWLWRFYSSANHKHVNRSAVLLRDLNLMSKALYHQIFSEQVIHFPLEEKGLLVLYNSLKRGKLELQIADLAQQHEMEVELLSPQQVVELNPGLQVDVLGGVLYRQDAHTNPVRFVQNLGSFLEKQGVEILRYTVATGFEFNQNNHHNIAGVITSEGVLYADEFVLCCGAHSANLLDKLEINLPLEAGKGYSVTIDSFISKPSLPLILAEARVAVTPMEERLRFAGTMELAGENMTINPNRVEGILMSVGEYLPDFHDLKTHVASAWCGLRPCSPDGLPYIGRFKEYQNLIAATGHAMMGLSLGPVTGKLVAEIVSNQPPSLDISLLNPDRFL
jgi:D-amino-acid dehydrogenase